MQMRIIFVCLIVWSQLQAAAHFSKCTWFALAQNGGVKLGVYDNTLNAYRLGEGISSGVVYRHIQENGSTYIRKLYREDAKATPQEDHQKLEILRSLNLSTFHSVRSTVVGDRILKIHDDIQGETVNKAYGSLVKKHPSLAADIAKEWNEIIDIFRMELKALDDQGKIQLELLYTSTPTNPTLHERLNALRFIIRWQGEEVRFLIHADNIVINWETGRLWIIDPW